MRNFANDADFPAVRHIGLNIGVDGEGGGFEAMVNDLAPDIVGGTLNPPDIMGGRLYIRPVPGFRMALGVSAVVDLNPARDFVDPATAPPSGRPPRETRSSSTRVWTSTFRSSRATPSGLVVLRRRRRDDALLPDGPDRLARSRGSRRGLATKAFLDSSARMPVKNWGAAAGFLGNLIIPDFTYRLQYELYTGSFQPAVLRFRVRAQSRFATSWTRSRLPGQLHAPSTPTTWASTEKPGSS